MIALFRGLDLVGVRHFLHPLRSAASLYKRINTSLDRRAGERPFRSIRRTRREGAGVEAAAPRRSNGTRASKCAASAGARVNWRPPAPDELEKLLLLISIGERGSVSGIHRLGRVGSLPRVAASSKLSLIRTQTDEGVAIEVGCAPGMLQEEQARIRCVGVESARMLPWLKEGTRCPCWGLPASNYRLAISSFHSMCGSIAAIHWLSSGGESAAQPNGVAIIQTAVMLTMFLL
jgi:hypothetical protein